MMAGDFRDRLFGFLRSRSIGQPGGLLAEVPPRRPSSVPLAGDDLGARFCNEFTAVGGEASDLAAGDDPAAQLGDWVSGLGLKTAVIDSDPAWSGIGFSIRDVVLAAGMSIETVDGSAVAADLADFDLGITLADAAIAETGTIAQCARPFRPRSISLVPRCHLALVPRDRLLAGFEDFFEGLTSRSPWAVGQDGFESYFTWITGPSRTADIEKTLTIGIHGPARTGAFLLKTELSDG